MFPVQRQVQSSRFFVVHISAFESAQEFIHSLNILQAPEFAVSIHMVRIQSAVKAGVFLAKTEECPVCCVLCTFNSYAFGSDPELGNNAEAKLKEPFQVLIGPITLKILQSIVDRP